MNYYIDPKTEDLIIYDPKENDIRVLESIEVVEYEDDGEEEPKPKKPKKPQKETTKKGGRGRKISQETINKMSELRNLGKTHTEIALELGISRPTVFKKLKEIKESNTKEGWKTFPSEEKEESKNESEKVE